MRKVLFITVYPSPYRVCFFTELGKYTDLTVYFTQTPEEIKHRDAGWFSDGYPGFRAVFPKKAGKTGRFTVHRDVRDTINEGYDFIIVCGWSIPTFMYAISYLKKRRVPVIMEIDGGFVSNDGLLKKNLKKHFISSAAAWLSPGRGATEYLVHYGARPDRVFYYPFTSQAAADMPDFGPRPSETRQAMRETARKKLGIAGRRVVLAVGQFIRRKGFDVLIKAAAGLRDAEVLIVGGEAPEEFVTLRRETGASNVEFVGFMKKDRLADYLLAADVFAMPTREDIWGLVVNEALSFGLPVVSTDRCGAALELVKDGENGFIVPAEDAGALRSAIEKALERDGGDFLASSLSAVKGHTLEKSAKRHLEIFEILESERHYNL
jgi:glycosyltransferase involved in cell wall biosynthesis